jgi:hypothetical protein
MSTDEEFEPAILGRQFRAERFPGTEPPLPKAILEVAQTCSDTLSLNPLVFAGIADRPIDLNEETIAALLEERETAYKNNDFSKTFYLSSGSHSSAFTLWLAAGCRPQQTEQVQFVAPERFPLEVLLAAIEQICSKFGAFYGYVWDSLTDQLHGRNMRWYERALLKRPPEEYQFVLKPLPIEGVPDTLPPLLFGYEFDYTCVPDGIWWINFWSSKYVETVGLERIRTADWFRIIEQPDGGLVLVLTEEPTDIRIPEHKEKLGAIVEHLRLRELQESHRIKT